MSHPTSIRRPLPSNPAVILVYQGPLEASLAGLENIWVWDGGYWREALVECAHRALRRPHPDHARQRYCTGCGAIMTEESYGYA